jgi:putative endonuclease
MKKYYVYILASRPNGTLYIGSTTNLESRVRAHKEGIFSGFTSKYNVKQLVYYEEYESTEESFKRERNMKEWRREWKIRLIEKNNRDWVDLSRGWIPAFAGTKKEEISKTEMK